MKKPRILERGLNCLLVFKKRGWGVRFERNAGRKGVVLPKLVCDALDRASPGSKRLGHLQDTLTPRKLFSQLAFVDGLIGERLGLYQTPERARKNLEFRLGRPDLPRSRVIRSIGQVQQRSR